MALVPDYGEAINLIAPDGSLAADMSGPMVTGVKAVLMRVLARLTTPRNGPNEGAVFYAADMGENVFELLNSTQTDAELAQKSSDFASEAEREQGVTRAVCSVRRDTTDARRVRVSLTCNLNGRTAGLNLIVGPGDAARVLLSGV